jgi:hypothetical protein
MCGYELRVTENQIKIFRLLNPPLASIPKTIDDSAFPFPYLGLLDANGPRSNSVVRSATRQVCYPRTGYHGLGWRTSFVHARPTDVLTFHERRPHSRSSQRLRQRPARLSSANHNRVISRGIHRNLT